MLGTFCSKDFFSGVSSFLERLITHFSWMHEEVEEVTAVLELLVVLEAIFEDVVKDLEMRYLSFLIWVFLYCRNVLELKDFTIIDRESNTLHHQAKEALPIHIKDPSLNRNIGKVRIPSVFNKLLKLLRQLELQHNSIPPPKGSTFFTWSFNTKDN